MRPLFQITIGIDSRTGALLFWPQPSAAQWIILHLPLWIVSND